MRETFVFYKSYYEAMKHMNQEDAYQLFQAICGYIFEGVEPELEGTCQMAFLLMVPTIEAACKRHDLSEKGNQARWGKKAAEQTSSAEPSEKTVPPAAPAESAPAAQSSRELPAQSQPEPPRFRVCGRYCNVFLTDWQREQLQQQIPDCEAVINRFSKQKLPDQPLMWDYLALLEFAKTGEVPRGRFVRQPGQKCNPDGSCGCHRDGSPITREDLDKFPPYGHDTHG